MVASVEAIFLSTFGLISQNRLAAVADKRADLDLQISLLTEHEITKVVGLLNDMAANSILILRKRQSFRKLRRISPRSEFSTKSKRRRTKVPARSSRRWKPSAKRPLGTG